MQPILTIATRAARAAADKLSYTLANIDSLTVEGDSREEVFSNAIDDAAWRARKAIRKAHQRHHIDCLQIGFDESRDHDGESSWQINIISGETNYRSGYPNYLINISFYKGDRIEAVVLLDPANGDEFNAMRGRGTQLNERRVRVAGVSLDQALAGIEASNLADTARWGEQVAGVRVTGCALASIANLVAGRVQIAFAEGLNAVDFAAASLLLQEAGALAGDRTGGPASASKGELLAAAPKTFKQWLVATR